MPTLPITPADLAIALLLVTIGSTLQGAIGFGMAVVSAPVLLLVNPLFVPGPLLLAAALLVMLIAYRDRSAVVVRDVPIGTIGRVLGTIPAAYAVSVLPIAVYDVLFAGLVLLGVVISALGWHIAPTRVNVVSAGALSGFTGTISCIGGPPMALVYQYERGPRVRGTLSAIFILGTLVSITGLWWAGHFGLVELAVGLLLCPAVLLGFVISRHTNRLIDRAHPRPYILAVSALSALVVLVRALW